jgi:ABC-type transport system involved in multi-copper enzyme maturation permease subunit
MNPVTTAFVIARQTLTRLRKSRVLWLMLLGTFAGAGLFYFVSRRAAPQTHGDVAFGLMTYLTYMQFVLPFGALYFGIQAVQGDLEDRTSVYLFARPLSRPAMLLGKWLAAAVAATLLVLFGICLLFGALSLRTGWRGGVEPPARMLAGYAHGTPLAALAYAALGAWFGAWLKRPLILGIVFLVGWEGVVANLARQASARSFTVTDALRRLLIGAHQPRHEYEEVLLGPLQTAPDPSALDPSLAMLRFAAITLALAAWIYARREYDARVAE